MKLSKIINIFFSLPRLRTGYLLDKGKSGYSVYIQLYIILYACVHKLFVYPIRI